MKRRTRRSAQAAAITTVLSGPVFGVNGDALKQITDDSGSGAVLGGFEGQVFALGPALDLTLHVGNRPVVTNLRYFYEFGVENRLVGQAAFLNIAVPLGALPAGHAAD